MIVQEHIDFMRSVVELARKYGVNNIKVDFDLNSTENFLQNKHLYNRTNVIATWSEGRHGENNRIMFDSTDRTSVYEREEIK